MQKSIFYISIIAIFLTGLFPQPTIAQINSLGILAQNSQSGTGLFGSLKSFFSGNGGTFSGAGASGIFGGNSSIGQAPAKNTFGGKLTVLPYPSCSASCGFPGFQYVTIGPPKGGTFIIPPTVKKYMNANVSSGSWVMGEYSPGGVCYMRAGKFCVPLPAQGTITRIGTS